MQHDIAGLVGKYPAMVAGHDLDADMPVEREQILIIAAAEDAQRDVDPASDAIADIIHAMRAHSRARLAFKDGDAIFVFQQIGSGESGNTRTDNGETGLVPLVCRRCHQA